MHNDSCVSLGLRRTSTKTGGIVTLYNRELLKKTPSLVTFCTQ